MKIVNHINTKHLLTLLATCSALYVHQLNAAEWYENFESQAGFSEFAPPSLLTNNQHNKSQKEWRSGSSFNETGKERYVPPAAAKNPWKPVKSFHYKKTFGSNRPWGKVPDRKPGNSNSMKFHDQRFKQWVNQSDSSYHNNFLFMNPSLSHGSPYLLYGNNYGYPGAAYMNPLAATGVYPGGFYPGVNYPGGMYPGGMYRRGIYPGGIFPGNILNTGLVNNPLSW